MTTKKTARVLALELLKLVNHWYLVNGLSVETNTTRQGNTDFSRLLDSAEKLVDDYVAEATRGEPNDEWPDAVYLGTREVNIHVVGLLHRFDRGARTLALRVGKGFPDPPPIGARGTLRRWGLIHEFEEYPA